MMNISYISKLLSDGPDAQARFSDGQMTVSAHTAHTVVEDL
jgi:hypothetical protein